MGIVTKLNEPRHQRFVCILPLLKGRWDNERNQWVITQNYGSGSSFTVHTEMHVAMQETLSIEVIGLDDLATLVQG